MSGEELWRRAAGALACASAFALAIGCGGAAAPARVVIVPDAATWRHGRERLTQLSGSQSPRTFRVALAMTEPNTGRTLEARGAVAVAPPDGLRMILVGPGGATALDLWLAGDRYRFAVPPIDLLRRGALGAGDAASRGLPVAFLRWWLLRPLGGSMLWYERYGGDERFVLRDGAALVDVIVAADGSVHARRAAGADVETIDADRFGCGHAAYVHERTGLSIAVRCEGTEKSAPRREAFDDPDGAKAGEGS